jgi:2-iminobutanoate/2-iminopropanoate deaminase
MQRSYVNLTDDLSRGMGALAKSETPAVYSDAVRVEISDCVFLFISGKTGVDESHQLVGRTMLEQTEQVLKNISAVLKREGGTMDDIVRVRVYVTQLDSQSLRDIHAVRARFFSEGKYPASTLVRIDQLVRDGGLIEIEADAVLKKV